MSNINVKDGAGTSKYKKAVGAGSDADPFVESMTIEGVAKVSGKDGVDSSTNTLQTIDYAHHEIHSGSHYYVQGHVELDTADTFYVKLETPDTTKWSHFRFEIASSGICSTTFDEEATGGMTGGAGKIPINNNRNSSNTSGMTFTAGVTACTGYTARIEDDAWGAEGFRTVSGGGSSRDDELVLKQGTVYCRGFVSASDDNVIQFRATWYEHTSKN